MNHRFACRPVALVVVASALVLAFVACASDPSGTSATSSAGAGAIGAGGASSAGSAGQAGASGSAVGAVANGGGAGASAGAAGSLAASGASGAAGNAGSAGSAGSAGAPAACPGAGKALHFQDDLNGTSTKSTQLQAELDTDLPIGDSARTIELWVYMEGKESWKSEHSFIEYGGTNRCQAFGIDVGDNANNDPVQLDPFTFSGGGPCTGDNNLTVMPSPPRTGWFHMAWVYDPTGKLAYLGQQTANFLFTVNGVPQPIPNKIETGHLLTIQTKLVIGSGQITDNGFTGKMDEFRIWNVARTASEIADNYKLLLKGSEPGLVAYYHFDEGSGTTAKDASSKKHDAQFGTDGGRPTPTWVDSTDLTLTCAP